jgi:hypothetical protein
MLCRSIVQEGNGHFLLGDITKEDLRLYLECTRFSIGYGGPRGVRHYLETCIAYSQFEWGMEVLMQDLNGIFSDFQEEDLAQFRNLYPQFALRANLDIDEDRLIALYMYLSGIYNQHIIGPLRQDPDLWYPIVDLLNHLHDILDPQNYTNLFFASNNLYEQSLASEGDTSRIRH